MAQIDRLDALADAARAQGRGGLGSLDPEVLYHLYDAAREVGELGHARLVRDALYSVQSTDPDRFAEVLDARIAAEQFDRQREVVSLLDSGERFVALCCGRRGGKTKLEGQLAIRYLNRAQRGQDVVFAGPTVVRAKELICDELDDAIDRHALAWKMSRALGTVRTGAGGMLRMAGLSSDAEVERFARGGNTLAFLVDEAGVCARKLKLLQTAVGPALSQTRAPLIFSGTPGQVESGDWWEACQGSGGFVHRNWNLRDNPFLGRDPEELLTEERERNGWDEQHPEYVTEYLGRWITNPSKLVFELDRARDCVPVAPQYDARTWHHFVGIDYGFLPDPCAWVVIACPPHIRLAYVIHCETHGEYDSEQIARKTLELAERFRPIAIVGDSASGGLNFMADFNRRYGRGKFVIQSAEKYDKPAGISVINTELRLGRLKFLPECKRLVDDLARLQWQDEYRDRILEGAYYPEDLPDAFRYAFLRCDAHFAQAEKVEANRQEAGIRAANERALREIHAGRWGGPRRR